MSAFAIDTSAIVAIFLKEPERQVFLEKIILAYSITICTATILEVKLVLQMRKGSAAVADFDEMISLPMFEVVSPTIAEIDIAYHTLLRYGKGNGHPAQLNYGDLFSYATAKSRHLPLLYKGQDFAQTDIQVA